ncbi:hypothetical protein HDU67_006077, partial [Dinochytrium kinnereticum]
MASDPASRSRILRWVEHGVRVEEFLVPYDGTFQNRRYTSAFPLPRVFRNYPVSPTHAQFVLEATESEILSGARIKLCPTREAPISLIPLIVSPTGVEPSKPRKFDDCTYLNLWMRPPHFHLPTLIDITHWRVSVASIVDLKAAFFNIPIHPSSRKYFGTRATLSDGVEWFLVACVLVFGWSPSPFVAQSLADAVCLFARSWTIPMSVYIDDIATAARSLRTCVELCSARDSATILLLILVLAGYTPSLTKSVTEPRE